MILVLYDETGDVSGYVQNVVSLIMDFDNKELCYTTWNKKKDILERKILKADVCFSNFKVEL